MKITKNCQGKRVLTCFLIQKTEKKVFINTVACCKHIYGIPQAKMPKRKSSTDINKSAKKISLEDIIGIDGGLEIIEKK